MASQLITLQSDSSRDSYPSSSPGWTEFWDSKHSIYVNARHEAAHFRRIADDIRRYAPERGVMLDYGCGEALSADRIAESVSRLILCEQAPNVRVMLGARFAGNDKIAVRKPEDIAMMPAGWIDAIVMHSMRCWRCSAVCSSPAECWCWVT
jgi:hypothetical protein